MALTPVDILHLKFKTSFRGYDRQQVDEFIKSVTQSLETALKEKTELQRKLTDLEAEVARIRGIESSLSNALMVAQKSADELKANAHRQVEMMLREAEQARIVMTVEAQQEAERCRTEIALLQATRDRFETEMKSMLEGYMEWLGRRRNNESADDVKELGDVRDIEEVKELHKLNERPELPEYRSEVA